MLAEADSNPSSMALRILGTRRAAMVSVMFLTLAMVPSTVHHASAATVWSVTTCCAGGRRRLSLRGGRDDEERTPDDILASVEHLAGRNDEMRLKSHETLRVARKVASSEKPEAHRQYLGLPTLQEFKVGRMVEEGDSLKPMPDRGLATVEKSEDDWMMHLKWKPRHAESSTAPEDLLLLPEACSFERARMWHGKPISGARVYCLRYNDTNEAFYFWMQEASLEADDIFFNRVDHVLNPPVRDDDSTDQGWRWTSHIQLSLADNLHLRLVNADGTPHRPDVPGPEDEYWKQLALNVSEAHRQRWLGGDTAGGLQMDEGAGTVAAPQFRPRGGQHWMFWEPYGATRLTHWDPISISCATPDAVIRYKYAENYDEVWESEANDEEPHEWTEYSGPFALPRPGLHDEMGFEGWRVKAAAFKEGLQESPVTTAEFVVYIHYKDMGRLRLQDYLDETDTMWNLTHPATIELDRRIRRAAIARKRYWADEVDKHARGVINETTEQIFDLEEEQLGRTNPKQSEEQMHNGQPLPPGAVCLDQLTGVPLDAEGFPVMPQTRMAGSRLSMPPLRGHTMRVREPMPNAAVQTPYPAVQTPYPAVQTGGAPGVQAPQATVGSSSPPRRSKGSRKRKKEGRSSGSLGRTDEGSEGPEGGMEASDVDMAVMSASDKDKAGMSSSLGLDDVVTSLQSMPPPSQIPASPAGSPQLEPSDLETAAPFRLRHLLAPRGPLSDPELHRTLLAVASDPSLAELLPAGDSAAEVLKSPQFAQAVDHVEGAIVSGMGQGLCAALGLDVDANVMAGGGFRALKAVLDAIQQRDC